MGDLLKPPAAEGDESPLPAVVIMGPVAFVRQQSPQQYATRLARGGVAALIFDPRHHGESAGEPRRLESGQAKMADVQAALDYLATRPEIDTHRLYGLGICQGINWMVGAANRDQRLRAIALVAGHYLTQTVHESYAGGAEPLAARLERAEAARQRYEETGEVEYIPVTSPDDPNALLTPLPIHQWYQRWDNDHPIWDFQGRWENRLARMSELDIWGHRIDGDLANLKRPTLVIHADRAASGPEAPRRLFETIPAEKSLVWLGDRVQFQFYEETYTIDLAAAHVADWFRRH
ncbi:MAG: alpha/beta hydrolase [Candidatus Competibacterales bacterium]